MILECLPTGMFGSNCYIIGDSGTGLIIDPGADSGEIGAVVGKHGLKVAYILLTHGHIDHICSVNEVKQATGASVRIHPGDAGALVDPALNGSALFGDSRTFKPADGLLEDGDELGIGTLKAEILHTPGHSPGCICIKIGNAVFTGDTLFAGSIGRTDLGNGSYEEIMHSIRHRLMALEDTTVVYPGHGAATTIGRERKSNPFLRRSL